MRTLLIIVAGLLLLGAFLFTGSRMGGATAMVTAAKLFIPLWLVAALINMGFGVVRAGYSVVDETPIALVIFAVPAVAAAIVWWKFS
jgi:hypothetical protein